MYLYYLTNSPNYYTGITKQIFFKSEKVTTDAPQLHIANSQTWSQQGINDNIVFAPNWAAVQGTPTVHYTTSLTSRNGYKLGTDIKTPGYLKSNVKTRQLFMDQR